MSRYISLLFITLSCTPNAQQGSQTENPANNEELQAIYEADQSDRITSDIDWAVVSVRDQQRRKRVNELLDSNLVISSDDYANAAMIFQHGMDTIASAMAVTMMRKAIELDSTRSKWLLAAAIDRDLMRRNKPQIYGTQYRKMGDNEPWVLYNLDSTQVTDAERIAHGVETLAEQREKLKNMNARGMKAK